jgi:hypothetical protein
MPSFRAGLIARSAQVDTTPPNTIRALAGIFNLTGEDMTIVRGYAVSAGVGAFALTDPGTTKLTPPVATGNVWNNADKGPAWIVSGSPALVATTGITATEQIIRAANGHSSGKYYFEYVLTNKTTLTCCGLSTAAFPLSGTFLGTGSSSVAYTPNSGGVIINGGNFWGLTAYGTGDNVGFAIDLTNMKLFIRLNGGQWNNDAANHDPNTNLNGIPIPMSAGTYFVTGFDNVTGGIITANFGQTPYAFAKPTGYLDW